jgi:hypothetical protein
MPHPTTSHAVSNVSISNIIAVTSDPGTGTTPLHGSKYRRRGSEAKRGKEQGKQR